MIEVEADLFFKTIGITLFFSGVVIGFFIGRMK